MIWWFDLYFLCFIVIIIKLKQRKIQIKLVWNHFGLKSSSTYNISTNQQLRKVRSWPWCLHQRENQGVRFQRFFLLLAAHNCHFVAQIFLWEKERKTSGTGAHGLRPPTQNLDFRNFHGSWSFSTHHTVWKNWSSRLSISLQVWCSTSYWLTQLKLIKYISKFCLVSCLSLCGPTVVHIIIVYT